MSKYVSYAILREFTSSIFKRCGVPDGDACAAADCLLYANLSGVDSHGIVHLAHYVRRIENGTIKASPGISFARRSPGMLSVNGDDGLGHVVTVRAIEEGIGICREQGSVGIVVSHSSHFGMGAYHLKKITDANMVGMLFTHTDSRIVPTGARTPFFGTNPVGFGFPSLGEPVILDFATSTVPFGRVSVARAEHRSIPADWGFDKNGESTTDPELVVGLRPIAEHKGSGLAMVVDLFSSLFSGMPFGPHINQMFGDLQAPRKLGHFIALWDPSKLVPIEQMKRRASDYITELHALPRRDPATPVYFPGEVEAVRRVERLASGIPIDPGLRQSLVELGERLDVSVAGIA